MRVDTIMIREEWCRNKFCTKTHTHLEVLGGCLLVAEVVEGGMCWSTKVVPTRHVSDDGEDAVGVSGSICGWPCVGGKVLGPSVIVESPWSIPRVTVFSYSWRISISAGACSS